jgi:pilus assembly protein Flp/PilA
MEEKEMEKIRTFFKDESGASMVEYGLLVALIAVVCVVAITAIGTRLNTQFEAARDALPAGS